MNLMNFSRHQKQHLRQHSRNLANLFCATEGGDTFIKVLTTGVAAAPPTFELVVQILQQNPDDLNDGHDEGAERQRSRVEPTRHTRQQEAAAPTKGSAAAAPT